VNHAISCIVYETRLDALRDTQHLVKSDFFDFLLVTDDGSAVLEIVILDPKILLFITDINFQHLHFEPKKYQNVFDLPSTKPDRL